MGALPAIARFARRLRSHFERRRFRRELAEELETHRALKLRQHTDAGLSPHDAAAQTRRDMGNTILAAEQSADIRGFLPLDHLMHDVRHSFRLLKKNFGFSAVAILSLALAIGGNTAVFSMVNALLIRPLPFAEPQRLVRITEFFPAALLVWFRQQSRTMDIASVSPGVDLNVTGNGPAFHITASPVSANLFSVLGAPVAIGRAFDAHEDQPARDRVVILSHQLWTQRFNADPGVIGQTITINGIARRIVGVMPAGFAFPSARVQLWFPTVIDPRNQVKYWAGDFTPLIARLRPGATTAQARGEIRSLAAGVWHMFPWIMPRNWNANATVIPLQNDLAGDARSRLLMLLCTVGAVLVIACANVAGLLTARGEARRRELAMRAALGAGRFRIVRQLLTESVVLASAAGLLGLALGASAIRLFASVISSDIPGASRIGIDWNVAAFTAALAVLAGISFGIAPALSASRLNLLESVRTGGQRSTAAGSVAFRSWLIAGEVGLTLMLVIAAGLLVRSLYALANVNPGFNSQHVLTLRISPDSAFCKQPSACIAFYDRLLNEARAEPGVIDAAMANTVPFDGSAPDLPVDVEDHPKTPDFPSPMFWSGAITPGYLRLMGIPLLTGRAFNASDTRESEPVILISAATARRFWPGQNAVGKHIRSAAEARWRTVIGVVADVRQFNLNNRAPGGITGAMYMPYSQAIDGDNRIPAAMNLIVKSAGAASQVGDQLRRAAVSLDPNIPVSGAQSLDSLLGDSVAHFRSTTWLFLSFAGVALILATIGIYGLVSYSVTQRAGEIGLRMALGATAGGILRMILVRSLKVTLLGLAVGLIGALVTVRALSSLLYDVAPTDPLVYALVSVFLLAVSATASLIPAWRASRIDPIRILRAE
ncbi:MAG TPA: ABC transporter permease [Bryobacteraceae bacterium]|nr:ABC transporter permease [Bryobacteraceae bacterium]